MVLFSLFPVFIPYLFWLHCSILDPVAAHPTSRFSHDVQTLATREIHPDQVSTPKHIHRAQDVESFTTRLRRRGLPGAVYICTKDNFRGDCAWTAPNDQCHIVGTGDNSPRSIGPDENGSCVLFEKATCTGNQVKSIRYPGLASNIPTFMSLKCYADDPPAANATGTINNAGRVGGGILPAGKNDADPRLAGGLGSMERKNLKDIMDAMEKDGFSQGMIGLKKGHYY
ncbi:hypothetical protein N0V90_008494 [Kalmusia sp. IMI 367209]|nr:hypothetical protein N0V90_008494 [Kalmusia sp. IMI 367209]